MISVITNKFSEGVAKLRSTMASRAGGLKAFQGSGFAIATILLVAISTTFFVQTLRSVIIAPAVLPQLIPLLVGIIAAPVVSAFLSLVCNDLFLGLAGSFVLVIGRGFLLLPADPANLIYFTGMICSVFGYMLVFLGVLGAALKRTPIAGVPDAGDMLPGAIAGGVLLGMAMNLALRLPNPSGVNLMENVLVNVILSFIMALVSLYWYAGHHREHNILKEPLGADVKRGKAKRFRKTLHVFMLGPCFGILGFYFNRPEWIAAASGIPYTVTAYILVLAILAAPLLRALGLLKEKVASIVILVCIGLSLVGLGFMHYLPPGPHVLALVVPAPFGLGAVIDRAIRLSTNERADNIDITIIFAWMVALAGILVSNVIMLLLFVPYAGAIITAITLAHVAIDIAMNWKREKEVAR